MSGPSENHPAATPDEIYNESYYSSHLGAAPYERTPHWLNFFGAVADELVRAFAPRRAFDAGCALGFLVESLWDRGVETYGRDVSSWAISQVRLDIRPFCAVGSITAPIEGEYDLVTCIEVLEHIPEAEALKAIEVLAAAAPRILFSSSPDDLAEPTHCNVKPPIYWLTRWAEAGFAPTWYNADFLAPHAILLERSETGRSLRDLNAFAERIRYKTALAHLAGREQQLVAQLAAADKIKGDQATRLETAEAALAQRDAQTATLTTEAGALTAHLASADEIKRDHVARLEAAEAARNEFGAQTAALMKEAEALAAQLASADEIKRDQAARLAAAETALAQRDTQAAAMKTEAETALAQLEAQTTAIWKEAEAARAALARGELESRRLRAVAAQRTSEARAEASTARKEASQWNAVAAYWDGQNQAAQIHNQKLAAALEVTRHERDSILMSTAWRSTAPLRKGAALLPPIVRRYALWAAKAVVWTATGQLGRRMRIRREFFNARKHAPFAQSAPEPAPPVPEAQRTEPLAPAPPGTPPAPPKFMFSDVVANEYRALEALRVYPAHDTEQRINVVTDSINAGSLYGGVGTSLILAALLAKRLGARVRLVTRTQAPDNLGAIAEILKLHDIDWDGNLEALHSPHGPEGRDVPIGTKDIFLTTSWWTTWATRRAVDPSRIVHLLQEDERGFYPLGDDHLRCSEMLADPDIFRVVNSNLLMGYLQDEEIAKGGIAFEPAFPRTAYDRGDSARTGLKNFFFYARPNNLRNLYWRGQEAIAAAIEEGVLDRHEWTFNFVGKDAQDLVFPHGVRPRLIQNMPWSDYAQLIRTVDLGLSLMSTPHPSYPPLDLAASGAVVVTNKYGPKTSLEQYSRNIICAEPTVQGLVQGLRDGKALALDSARRSANFQANGMQRRWQSTLAPTLDLLTSRYGV